MTFEHRKNLPGELSVSGVIGKSSDVVGKSLGVIGKSSGGDTLVFCGGETF